MTNAEKIELALMPVFGTAIWFSAANLPPSIELGRLLMWSAGLLLMQGLLRDLWILSRAGQNRQTPATRAAPCLCMESTLGMLIIALGALLSSSTLDVALTMNAAAWSLLATAILLIGFLLKDWVIEWSPWQIRRERDHLNLLVGRKQT